MDPADRDIPRDIMAELQAAADRPASGARDAEAMRRGCEEMDRIRAEILRAHAVLDIGVPAIRALRDGDEG